jgi:hypothetical protein
MLSFCSHLLTHAPHTIPSLLRPFVSISQVCLNCDDDGSACQYIAQITKAEKLPDTKLVCCNSGRTIDRNSDDISELSLFSCHSKFCDLKPRREWCLNCKDKRCPGKRTNTTLVEGRPVVSPYCSCEKPCGVCKSTDHKCSRCPSADGDNAHKIVDTATVCAYSRVELSVIWYNELVKKKYTNINAAEKSPKDNCAAILGHYLREPVQDEGKNTSIVLCSLPRSLLTFGFFFTRSFFLED